MNSTPHLCTVLAGINYICIASACLTSGEKRFPPTLYYDRRLAMRSIQSQGSAVHPKRCAFIAASEYNGTSSCIIICTCGQFLDVWAGRIDLPGTLELRKTAGVTLETSWRAMKTIAVGRMIDSARVVVIRICDAST